MKTIFIILLVLFVTMMGIIIVGVTEQNDRNKAAQKEIDHLRTKNILMDRSYLKALDSITKVHKEEIRLLKPCQ